MKYFNEQLNWRILLYGTDVDSDDFGFAGSGPFCRPGWRQLAEVDQVLRRDPGGDFCFQVRERQRLPRLQERESVEVKRDQTWMGGIYRAWQRNLNKRGKDLLCYKLNSVMATQHFNSGRVQIMLNRKKKKKKNISCGRLRRPEPVLQN